MSETERRYFFELRQTAGRIVEGVAVRYSDVAELPWGKERFEPRAFGDLAGADVMLNVQHDRGRPIARTGGGLTFDDNAERLALRAELPSTREADDTLALIRAQVLRGLSVEFLPVSERLEGGTRVIERAKLAAVAVVDVPAYSKSEVAARMAARKPAPKRRRWYS